MRLLSGTFRQRIALLFVTLMLAVGLPTYWYIERVYERNLLEHERQDLRDLGHSIATVLAQNIHERQREVILLSQMPLFRQAPFDSADLTATLERVQNSYPDYSWIGLVDRQGIVRAATLNQLVGTSVKDRPWFSDGILRPSVLGPAPAPMLTRVLGADSRDGPLWLINFSAPVLDDNGTVRGVLEFRARKDWVGRVVAPLIPGEDAVPGLEVFVLGEHDAVIHRVGVNAVPADSTGRRPDPPFFPDDPDPQTSTLTAVIPVSDASLATPVGWSVVVARPAELTLADANTLKRALITFQILAALAFAALAWWLAGLLSRPMEQLSTVARQIEAGDENADFAVKTSSFEARELVDALRGMADTLLNRQQALVESNRQVMQHAVELEDGNKQLRWLSRRDALTGLANRLAADERLNDEFVRMKRTKTGYVVLLMDIDFFKRVNDTLGHAVGDEVLRHVGSILKWRVRESDFLARYGGEEFLAILPATDVAAARKVAEKIRSALETEPLPAVGTITLSIGLAMSRPEQRTADEVVIEADRWLYAAKRAGRNQVAGSGIETSHGLRQGQAAGSG